MVTINFMEKRGFFYLIVKFNYQQYVYKIDNMFCFQTKKKKQYGNR